MAPNTTATPVVFNEPEFDPPKSGLDKTPLPPREYHIKWFNVAFHAYINLSMLYGAYLGLTSAHFLTNVFTTVSLIFDLVMITAGVHRLWAHRSYKARLPLRIFLMLGQSHAYQDSIFSWVRDHRLHHKYPDDDADPYNPKRGFFYSHCGWQMVKRHPRCIEKGRKLELTDLREDKVVEFQRIHYKKISIPVAFIIPVIIPMYFWKESFSAAYHLNLFRYTLSQHITLTVNSIAHNFGYKPYDTRITPNDNGFINFLSVGEGWHNYHHVFPWDYRSMEYGAFYFNMTTWFIEIMAKLGLAYDLKTATKEMVDKRVAKTGDSNLRYIKDK